MTIELTALHYVYLIFIIAIIIAMIMKKDITLICIIGIFALGVIGTDSIYKSAMGVFNSFIYATKELMPTILIISVITAMSNTLAVSGINQEVVSPFKKVIRSYGVAYWVIGLVMMVLSWFFWPSPAVALIGALFLPIAKKAGLPAMGAAIAMNLFGHGIALSSDYVIQAAPKITADAAGIEVSKVIEASVPLTVVMAVVTTVIAFYMLRKDIKSGNMDLQYEIEQDEVEEENSHLIASRTIRKILALVILILFAVDIIIMYFAKLQGGDATALIGGTAIFILSIVSILSYKKDALENITNNLVKGLQFGFKIFGIVIPVAAFFI